MQQNNFESIIRTWRRLSGELVENESTVLSSMSGDSHANPTHKKKQEESDLLVPDRTRPAIGAVVGAGTGATLAASDTDAAKEEKKELIKSDSDEKEAAGDTKDKDSTDDDKSEADYLENKESILDKSPENKWPSGKFEDKVDSVFLRQPPPHKSRSATTTAEEEDCGIFL